MKFYGSINLTRILAEAKKNNKAFFRSEKGIIYCNINIYTNDEPDQFGNHLAIVAYPGKDNKDDKFYLGNCKRSEPASKDLSADDLPDLEEDGMPF